VNYFQHIPFLENAKAAAGFNLVYARDHQQRRPVLEKVQKLRRAARRRQRGHRQRPDQQRPWPATAGQGRADHPQAGRGYKATEDDIANPKKIKILQVEAVQLVRAYDDADLVQGYPAYIRLAKTFDATSALLFDGLETRNT
jgi:D-methionine transport system substrate-binding protein